MRNAKQTYRLKAPISGNETVVAAEPGLVYVDSDGEELQPVAETIPLAPSESNLPRTVGNLRTCARCNDLIGIDVSDCPYCGKRQPPLG